MNLGKITGREIKKNKDSDVDRIILQIEMLPDDVRTVELISQAGEDTNPADNCRAVVVDVANDYKAAIAVSDDLTPEVNAGEKELYSTDTPVTEKRAKIKLCANGDIEIDAYGGSTLNIKQDGNIDINGASDFAVAYNDLKTAFDQLKSDYDNFVTTKYNLHAHTGVTVGGGSTGATATVGAASTADMSPAKVSTVRLP